MEEGGGDKVEESVVEGLRKVGEVEAGGGWGEGMNHLSPLSPSLFHPSPFHKRMQIRWRNVNMQMARKLNDKKKSGVYREATHDTTPPPPYSTSSTTDNNSSTRSSTSIIIAFFMSHLSISFSFCLSFLFLYSVCASFYLPIICSFSSSVPFLYLIFNYFLSSTFYCSAFYASLYLLYSPTFIPYLVLFLISLPIVTSVYLYPISPLSTSFYSQHIHFIDISTSSLLLPSSLTCPYCFLPFPSFSTSSLHSSPLPTLPIIFSILINTRL